jgi:hypothetical protein
MTATSTREGRGVNDSDAYPAPAESGNKPEDEGRRIVQEELKGPLATLWGTYYPKGYVVAVVHEREAADRAAAALRAAGFGEEDVRVHTGQEVVDRHERFRASMSVGQRIGAGLPSDEHEALNDYLEEARQGRHFLTVHAPAHELVHRARDVLRGYGGHAMRYYGELTIEDLG